MAAAHGYDDGEDIPLSFVLTVVARICASVDLPVTVDFEGGYAVAPDDVAENVRKVIHAGAVGINFEDRVVKGQGLYPINTQAARIAKIRDVAKAAGIPFFLNARTDLFLGSDPSTHDRLLEEAKEREAAYREAGASGFFVPGLTDPSLISQVSDAAKLPVNVMMMDTLQSVADVVRLGVSRISYGPGPYLRFKSELAQQASAVRNEISPQTIQNSERDDPEQRFRGVRTTPP